MVTPPVRPRQGRVANALWLLLWLLVHGSCTRTQARAHACQAHTRVRTRTRTHTYVPAGECSADELERMMGIVANPRAYKIPDWFLNRQRDHKTGRFSQARREQSGCAGQGIVRPHPPARRRRRYIGAASVRECAARRAAAQAQGPVIGHSPRAPAEGCGGVGCVASRAPPRRTSHLPTHPCRVEAQAQQSSACCRKRHAILLLGAALLAVCTGTHARVCCMGQSPVHAPRRH